VPVAIRGETPGGEEFTIYMKKKYGDFKTFNFKMGDY